MTGLARVLYGLLLMPAVFGQADAQPSLFPSRTIEIIVSYAAGGSTDFVARALAQRFQERLGQSVVVINKPGASGTIGAAQVTRANPDGHSLYAGFTTEMVVVPELTRNAKYSIEDFEPIAVTGVIPVMLIASKNVRANTLSELIDDVRRSPGKYTFGGSHGSPSHVMGVMAQPDQGTRRDARALSRRRPGGCGYCGRPHRHVLCRRLGREERG